MPYTLNVECRFQITESRHSNQETFSRETVSFAAIKPAYIVRETHRHSTGQRVCLSADAVSDGADKSFFVNDLESGLAFDIG